MNRYIRKADDLITSHEQTRAGFIEAALEKNRKAKPFIESARTLRVLACTAKEPMGLLAIEDIRPSLLTASGLSDKSLKYFTEDDKTIAIKELIQHFLLPAGDGFVDELVYRYLLIKGDSLGGSMRNFVGTIAKVKVTRKILSVLNTMEISYSVIFKTTKYSNKWYECNYITDYEEADDIYAITWAYNGVEKVIFFDTTIPVVGKNVDICLYKGGIDEFDGGNIINNNEAALMFGELKGGIDPAGADEHWKTGNTALERIRIAFNNNIKTSFVGAAIEKSMASEIWRQLSDGTLTNAANLTFDDQFTDYCEWIVKLV